MDPAFEAQLHEDGVTFTAEDAALLEAIDEQGSMNKAATALGRSYSRSQKRLTALETAFGTLVERTRGGAGGGGSRLTEEGRDLLAHFERLESGYAAVAEVAETVLSGTVIDREGELGNIKTQAGTVRAIVPPEAETVQVSIGADAVTLHAPSGAPPTSGTSARNRFDGQVKSITSGETISHVAVDIGAEKPLMVLVTQESLDRLGLQPGRPVVATFKATATRCTPI